MLKLSEISFKEKQASLINENTEPTDEQEGRILSVVSFAFFWRTTTIQQRLVVHTVPSIGALALLLRSSCVTKSTQHVQQRKNKTRGRNYD